MLDLLALSPIAPPRTCPVCGALHQTCTGANEPYVGRPLELAAMIEQPGERPLRVRAKEPIYRDKPGQPGARELVYNTGDYVREADARALGLVPDEPPREVVVPSDKAARGPREKRSASRDKALSQKEE